MEEGVDSVASPAAAADNVAAGQRLICGYCKMSCVSIEELKVHMKETHLPRTGSTATMTGTAPPQSTSSVTISEPKQAVLVYKQNADGSTSNTGQLVHLTQTQILQLLASSAKSAPAASSGSTVSAASASLSPADQEATSLNNSFTVTQNPAIIQVVPDNSASVSTVSTVTQQQKPKRLQIVPADNVDYLTQAQEELILKPANKNKGSEAVLVSTTFITENSDAIEISEHSIAAVTSESAGMVHTGSGIQSVNSIVNQALEAVAAAPPGGGNTTVASHTAEHYMSAEEDEADEEEDISNSIELKFRFPFTENDNIVFPEHIRPVVTFQCEHCNYKDSSFIKAGIHVRSFHLNADGTLNKRQPLVYFNNSLKNSLDTCGDTSNRDDLSCPYCLLKFPNMEQRDEHRIKSCGPKRRYEVKRTAVRTLQRHLMCNVSGCTRALYFGAHAQVIKHPRLVFGCCHRNNGSSHYFTCYICALKDESQNWKDITCDEAQAKIEDKLKKIQEQTDRIHAEATTSNSNSEPISTDKPLVEKEQMLKWDFSSWEDCANHLTESHSTELSMMPRCNKCDRKFTNCNSLCHHIFNHEIEYISNGLTTLKSRQDKKSLKATHKFGVPNDNAADEMLFLEIPAAAINEAGVAADEISSTSDLPPLDTIVPKKVLTIRGKRFVCRTCGEAFSTSTKRDKHTLSNACTKSIIERKHVCSVCKRRFQSRKTFITHESWCKYKKKRREREAEREDNSISNLQDGEDESMTGEQQVPPTAESSSKSFTDDSHNVTTDQSPPKKKPRNIRPRKYKCTVMGCRMGFETKEEFDIHLRCHINNTVAFQCCFCDFKNAANVTWFPLKEHIIAKHPGFIQPTYECEICVKGFAKLTKYQDHMSKHSEDKPFQCIECGSKFKQESGLRAHVQTEHSSEEARLMFKMNQAKKMNTQQLLCHICGYSTTSRSYYKTHMNIHKGVKPYSCPHCDYKSVDATCFKRHAWRHKEIKPYKCVYCNFEGIQRAQVVAHMKSKHGVWPAEARKLIRHISGKRASNWKDADESLADQLQNQNTTDPLTVHLTSNDQHLDLTAAAQSILQVSATGGVEPGTTTQTSVSIMNPDGTETTIPVELIAQASGAELSSHGRSVQVSYGDYVINYNLEKADDTLEEVEYHTTS